MIKLPDTLRALRVEAFISLPQSPFVIPLDSGFRPGSRDGVFCRRKVKDMMATGGINFCIASSTECRD